jgi:hypothetical protein
VLREYASQPHAYTYRNNARHTKEMYRSNSSTHRRSCRPPRGPE